MKYAILVVMFCVCCAVGWGMSARYVRRKKFFGSLIALAEKLSLEINFSRERLKVLIESVDESERKNLLGVDEAFLRFLDKTAELTEEELFGKARILKSDEKTTILLFFKALGRSDVENQTREIQTFVSRFEEKKKVCDDEAKRYGSLYFKLGIVAGLFLVVVFI